jgi:hypothetical protein
VRQLHGKLTAKIVIEPRFYRADSTCALFFMQIFLNGKRKVSAAHIISTSDFDKKKQRVKWEICILRIYNLIIEKALETSTR